VEEKVKLKITKETNTSGYSCVEQEKLVLFVCVNEWVAKFQLLILFPVELEHSKRKSFIRKLAFCAGVPL